MRNLWVTNKVKNKENAKNRILSEYDFLLFVGNVQKEMFRFSLS